MEHSLRPLDEMPELAWRVLGLLNLFRLLVPIVLGLVFIAASQPHLVGDAFPDLFRTACASYFIAGVGLIALLKHRKRVSAWHGYAAALIDTVLLALIVYSSGGAESGLGILLVIPVGALSLLVDTRGALIAAAASGLALLTQQAALSLEGVSGTLGFTQAGYYGAVLFLVAVGAAFMSRRLQETEAVIRQRDIDVANLAELSEYIVQHLRESIVVVDSEDRIRRRDCSTISKAGAVIRRAPHSARPSSRPMAVVRSRRTSRHSAATNPRRSSPSSRTRATLQSVSSKPSSRPSGVYQQALPTTSGTRSAP